MKSERLPVIPVRDVIGFPNMIFPILVGRSRSLSAVQEAMMTSRRIILVAQKDPTIDEVRSSDLYRSGIVGKILQIMRLPEGSMKVLIEGENRAAVRRFFFGRNNLEATITVIEDVQEENNPRLEALARKAIEKFSIYARMEEMVPIEIVEAIESSQDEPGKLADMIAAHLPLKQSDKQKLVATVVRSDRLGQILSHIARETEILRLEEDIDRQVKNSLSKSQRDYYLREQLEAIKEELGIEADYQEIENLREEIMKSALSQEAFNKAQEELDKLERSHPNSPETNVIRNYLDWILKLPWWRKTKSQVDIEKSEEILDKDHYGLKKVKERITEHIAVMSLSDKVRGPILCLVGPPGVGKTSLGRSVARALGREFVRVSLGGVRDESEIRGHRRTYIGSMPGRIIQQMKRAGTINPVFLLDEIDKLSSDFRGDPAAALLEALDPDQNKHFVDNYLEVEYNLSSVLFLTTANTSSGIPAALADRMEILRLPGYLLTEKIEIAKGYLIPKQSKEAGLKKVEIRISNDALTSLIQSWTQEAGVRELERIIGKLMRKIAIRVVKKGSLPKRVDISEGDLEKYLGVAPYRDSVLPEKLLPGESLGLAWTSFGGEILRIETAITDGKDNIILTGRLGEVMQESARTALTYVRSKLPSDIALEANKTLHLHVPEGAIPKDGPSAGVAIAVALMSLMLKTSIDNKIAMTGEISLAGHVLRIGGLSEKLLAAKRHGLE
ncbi:MAG TPA: endopeptidase La, partial [candidate division Zixibacteria bacterium]|nr:endopeptidase La [candidate division Zixibacteria bacterium]